MPKWLSFNQVGDTGKTRMFEVRAFEGDVFLGYVRWFSRWGKYAFFPVANTVFEQDCLKDISDFLDTLRDERRRDRREKIA